MNIVLSHGVDRVLNDNLHQQRFKNPLTMTTKSKLYEPSYRIQFNVWYTILIGLCGMLTGFYLKWYCLWKEMNRSKGNGYFLVGTRKVEQITLLVQLYLSIKHIKFSQEKSNSGFVYVFKLRSYSGIF